MKVFQNKILLICFVTFLRVGSLILRFRNNLNKIVTFLFELDFSLHNDVHMSFKSFSELRRCLNGYFRRQISIEFFTIPTYTLVIP